MGEFSKELIYQEYVMREEYQFHAPYNPEFEFYEAVKMGDAKKTEQMLKEPFCDKVGLGVLSENGIQSFKYHFAITAALLARYCVEGGMEHDQAYNMSDFYINKADKCNKLQEISDLHRKMVRDYVRRMSDLKRKKKYSKHVSDSMNYIYDHLNERIKTEDVANFVGVSRSYLSRLFIAETGVPISEYIVSKKIETARNMIEYSDYSASEISNILAFPSQSYFVKVFKKYTNMTPGKYQAFHFPSAII